MIKNSILQLPKFFNYKEEQSDSGYEALQDFFLSWTLRCAEEKYKIVNAKINEYARKTIYLLLHGVFINEKYELSDLVPDYFKVLKVETRRQNGGVDLIALVTIVDKANQQIKYALNIENKWYSSLKDHQLEKNHTHVKKHFADYEIVNLYITCDDCRPNYDREKEWCMSHQYKFFTIEDIVVAAEMELTGNLLFDTYWLNA